MSRFVAGAARAAGLCRGAALLALAWLAAIAPSHAADKLVLQLHGPPQFEFAGYYAALWRGFFSEAGLSVEIRPEPGRGQAAIDVARAVVEGRAQFGTGNTQLVVRAAQGQPLLLLAPIFQQSGAMVYYRADADFPSPSALLKARVARLPASDILDIELVTALRAEGIDPAKLRSVPIEPGRAVAALADRSADAVVGSAWELPWQAHERGIALKSANPADYRVEFYGDTLFTSRRFARVEPQTVRRFRGAVLKGWDYALQHSDEIAGRIAAELPKEAPVADMAGFARYQVEVARRLARWPDVALGYSNQDRWARVEASLVGAGAILRAVDPGDFVYQAEPGATSLSDLRAGAVLLAALATALVAGMLLRVWRRRRRAPVTALTSAGTAAAAPPEPAGPERPAAAPVPSRLAPVLDLNAVLSRSERPIRQRVPVRVSFRLSLLPQLWSCRSEMRAVRGIVLDLVAAAIADMRATGGELVVGTRNITLDEGSAAGVPGAGTGDYARLTVRDSGPGLAASALDRVLEPGVTPRPAVAAAAQAIRRLGGFIRVESAEGVGTAVHLYFPRAVEAAPATPAEAAE